MRSIQARIRPNSKHIEEVKKVGDIYEITVKSPAIEGRANTRATELIVKYFGVARTQVKLVRGAKS